MYKHSLQNYEEEKKLKSTYTTTGKQVDVLFQFNGILCDITKIILKISLIRKKIISEKSKYKLFIANKYKTYACL